jgi:hypothetical protein
MGSDIFLPLVAQKLWNFSDYYFNIPSRRHSFLMTLNWDIYDFICLPLVNQSP